MNGIHNRVSEQMLAGLKRDGAVFLTASDLGIALPADEKASLLTVWQKLPADPHLPNTPLTRRRTHARFLYETDNGTLTRLPDGPYFQSKESNPLYGGSDRTFAPTSQDCFDRHPSIHLLIAACAGALPCTYGKILINCHFMRIVGSEATPGEPSPEGVHRDGFDFVSLHLVNREAIRAGQSIVLDEASRIVTAPLMEEMFDTLVIDDRRCTHAALPFFVNEGLGFRDMILCSYEQYQL